MVFHAPEQVQVLWHFKYVVLRDVVYWEILMIGEQLDWMILEVFSNFGNSMIL